MKTRKPIKESLSYLIESELEKAEVILAAKDIADKVARMAETLAKVEGEDIMPMSDALRAAFGPETADAFVEKVVGGLRDAVKDLTDTKDMVAGEVDRLERILNGEDVTDMAADAGMEEPQSLADVVGSDEPEEPAEPVEDPIEDPIEAPEEPIDLSGPSAGRARKESVAARKRMIRESAMDKAEAVLKRLKWRYTEGGEAKERLERLKSFMTDDEADLFDRMDDGDLAKVFARVDRSFRGVLPGPISTPAEAPKQGVGMTNKIDVSDLKESADPDRTVYRRYLRHVGQGVDRATAVRRVAESFKIDAIDVIEIVRESTRKGIKEDFRADLKAMGYTVEKAQTGWGWRHMAGGKREGFVTEAKAWAHLRSHVTGKAVVETFRKAVVAGVAPVKAARRIAEQHGLTIATVTRYLREAQAVSEDVNTQAAVIANRVSSPSKPTTDAVAQAVEGDNSISKEDKAKVAAAATADLAKRGKMKI